MPRKPRPRCAKWLPRAKVNCPLPEGHAGRCRTPESMKVSYDSNAMRNRARAGRRYLWVDAYKTEHGCARCGYCEDPRALDFDHTDPETKVAGIARMLPYAPWSRIVAEIAKCTILCANCHRTKTFPMERRRPGTGSDTRTGPCDEITGSPPSSQ